MKPQPVFNTLARLVAIVVVLSTCATGINLRPAKVWAGEPQTSYAIGDVEEFLQNRPFSDYGFSIEPFSSAQYCSGSQFALDQNSYLGKLYARFNNCEAMQSFYDSSYNALLDTYTASEGAQSAVLNLELYMLDRKYYPVGINVTGLDNDESPEPKGAKFNFEYFANYVDFHKLDKDFSLTKASRAQQDSIDDELDILGQQIDSGTSVTNYLYDLYTNYFKNYSISQTEKADSQKATYVTYFEECRNANGLPPVNPRKPDIKDDDVCIAKWAGQAVKDFANPSSPGRKFANVSKGWSGAGEYTPVEFEPVSDVAAHDAWLVRNLATATANAKAMAKSMNTFELAIHDLIKAKKAQEELRRAKSAALPLRKDMVTPGYNPTTLSDDDLEMLQSAGVNVADLRKTIDEISIGLNPQNGVFGQLQDRYGDPMRLSTAGECADELTDVTNSEKFFKCLGPASDAKFQRPSVGFTLKSATSSVDSAADLQPYLDADLLPEAQTAELPEGQVATDVSFFSQIPSQFGGSNLQALIKTTTDAAKDKVFLNRPGLPTMLIDNDLVNFRPVVKINIPIGAMYIARIRITEDYLDPKGQIRTKDIFGQQQVAGLSTSVVFDRTTVREHIYFKAMSSGKDEERLDLDPVYFQEINATKSVVSSARLDRTPTNLQLFGKDPNPLKENNPCPDADGGIYINQCDLDSTDIKYRDRKLGNSEFIGVEDYDTPKVEFHQSGPFIANWTWEAFDKDDNICAKGQMRTSKAEEPLEGKSKFVDLPVSCKTISVHLDPTDGRSDSTRVLSKVLIGQSSKFDAQGTTSLVSGKNVAFKQSGVPWKNQKKEITGNITGISLAFIGSILEDYGIVPSIKSRSGVWNSTPDQLGFFNTDGIAGIRLQYQMRFDLVNFAFHTQDDNWQKTSDANKKTVGNRSFVEFGDPSDSAKPINNIAAALDGQLNSGISVSASFRDSGVTGGNDGRDVVSSYGPYFKMGVVNEKMSCNKYQDEFKGAKPVRLDPESDLWVFSQGEKTTTSYKYTVDPAHEYLCENNAVIPKMGAAKDPYGGEELGNVNYSNSSATKVRSDVSPYAKMTQISYQMTGDLRQWYTVYYSVYQTRPNGESGWTTWASNGSMIGDGQNPIKAIRARVAPNTFSKVSIPTIGDFAWVNGANSVEKVSVAYLTPIVDGWAHDRWENGWKFKSCSGAKDIHQSVQSSLGDCAIPDGAIVRLGSASVGGLNNEKSTEWTEPFVYNSESNIEIGYATFGDIFHKQAQNVNVFAYGPRGQNSEAISVVRKKISHNMLSTAFGIAQLAIMIPATIAAFAVDFLPLASAIGLLTVAILNLAATVGSMIVDLQMSTNPYLPAVEMSKKDKYFQDANGQNILDDGEPIQNPSWDTSANLWKVGGFVWGNYGQFSETPKIYYRPRKDPIDVYEEGTHRLLSSTPQWGDMKEYKFRAASNNGVGAYAGQLDDLSADGISRDWSKEQQIPDGSRICFALNDSKYDKKCESANSQWTFEYSRDSQMRAGYLSWGMSGGKHLTLGAYDTAGSVQKMIGNFAAKAAASNADFWVNGVALNIAFIALSVADVVQSAKVTRLSAIAKRAAKAISAAREGAALSRGISFGGELPLEDLAAGRRFVMREGADIGSVPHTFEVRGFEEGRYVIQEVIVEEPLAAGEAARVRYGATTRHSPGELNELLRTHGAGAGIPDGGYLNTVVKFDRGDGRREYLVYEYDAKTKNYRIMDVETQKHYTVHVSKFSDYDISGRMPEIIQRCPLPVFSDRYGNQDLKQGYRYVIEETEANGTKTVREGWVVKAEEVDYTRIYTVRFDEGNGEYTEKVFTQNDFRRRIRILPDDDGFTGRNDFEIGQILETREHVRYEIIGRGNTYDFRVRYRDNGKVVIAQFTRGDLEDALVRGELMPIFERVPIFGRFRDFDMVTTETVPIYAKITVPHDPGPATTEIVVVSFSKKGTVKMLNSAGRISEISTAGFEEIYIGGSVRTKIQIGDVFTSSGGDIIRVIETRADQYKFEVQSRGSHQFNDARNLAVICPEDDFKALLKAEVFAPLIPNTIFDARIINSLEPIFAHEVQFEQGDRVLIRVGETPLFARVVNKTPFGVMFDFAGRQEIISWDKMANVEIFQIVPLGSFGPGDEFLRGSTRIKVVGVSDGSVIFVESVPQGRDMHVRIWSDRQNAELVKFEGDIRSGALVPQLPSITIPVDDLDYGDTITLFENGVLKQAKVLPEYVDDETLMLLFKDGSKVTYTKEALSRLMVASERDMILGDTFQVLDEEMYVTIVKVNLGRRGGPTVSVRICNAESNDLVLEMDMTILERKIAQGDLIPSFKDVGIPDSSRAKDKFLVREAEGGFITFERDPGGYYKAKKYRLKDGRLEPVLNGSGVQAPLNYYDQTIANDMLKGRIRFISFFEGDNLTLEAVPGIEMMDPGNTRVLKFVSQEQNSTITVVFARDTKVYGIRQSGVDGVSWGPGLGGRDTIDFKLERFEMSIGDFRAFLNSQGFESVPEVAFRGLPQSLNDFEARLAGIPRSFKPGDIIRPAQPGSEQGHFVVSRAVEGKTKRPIVTYFDATRRPVFDFELRIDIQKDLTDSILFGDYDFVPRPPADPLSGEVLSPDAILGRAPIGSEIYCPAGVNGYPKTKIFKVVDSSWASRRFVLQPEPRGERFTITQEDLNANYRYFISRNTEQFVGPFQIGQTVSLDGAGRFRVKAVSAYLRYGKSITLQTIDRFGNDFGEAIMIDAAQALTRVKPCNIARVGDIVFGAAFPRTEQELYKVLALDGDRAEIATVDSFGRVITRIDWLGNSVPDYKTWITGNEFESFVPMSVFREGDIVQNTNSKEFFKITAASQNNREFTVIRVNANGIVFGELEIISSEDFIRSFAKVSDAKGINPDFAQSSVPLPPFINPPVSKPTFKVGDFKEDDLIVRRSDGARCKVISARNGMVYYVEIDAAGRASGPVQSFAEASLNDFGPLPNRFKAGDRVIEKATRKQFEVIQFAGGKIYYRLAYITGQQIPNAEVLQMGVREFEAKFGPGANFSANGRPVFARSLRDGELYISQGIVAGSPDVRFLQVDRDGVNVTADEPIRIPPGALQDFVFYQRLGEGSIVEEVGSAQKYIVTQASGVPTIYTLVEIDEFGRPISGAAPRLIPDRIAEGNLLPSSILDTGSILQRADGAKFEIVRTLSDSRIRVVQVDNFGNVVAGTSEQDITLADFYTTFESSSIYKRGGILMDRTWGNSYLITDVDPAGNSLTIVKLDPATAKPEGRAFEVFSGRPEAGALLDLDREFYLKIGNNNFQINQVRGFHDVDIEAVEARSDNDPGIKTYGNAPYNFESKYDREVCTFWAYLRRWDVGNPVPKGRPGLIDQFFSTDDASMAFLRDGGLTESRRPANGDLLLLSYVDRNEPRHMAFVEHVYDDGSILVSEANVLGTGEFTITRYPKSFYDITDPTYIRDHAVTFLHRMPVGDFNFLW